MRFRILLFTLPLLALSCKHKDDKKTSVCIANPSSCQTVKESKDFFFFKMGSWWVYEEETSHVRDSVYMTQSVESSSSYEFDVRMKSDLSGYEYHYWPEYYGINNDGCSLTGPMSAKCLYINRSKAKFQDFVAESYVFFLRYAEGEYTGVSGFESCINAKLRVANILPDYDHMGQHFQKTVVMKNDCDVAEGNQPTKFFHSKNIGIIRKELLDSNQVWNLVNYHIEP